MATPGGPRPRGCSTICLPLDKDLYPEVVASPARFREALDRCHRDMPELFPKDFGRGYALKDSSVSAKLGLRLRRITCQASGRTGTGPTGKSCTGRQRPAGGTCAPGRCCTTSGRGGRRPGATTAAGKVQRSG